MSEQFDICACGCGETRPRRFHRVTGERYLFKSGHVRRGFGSAIPASAADLAKIREEIADNCGWLHHGKPATQGVTRVRDALSVAARVWLWSPTFRALITRMEVPE